MLKIKPRIEEITMTQSCKKIRFGRGSTKNGFSSEPSRKGGSRLLRFTKVSFMTKRKQIYSVNPKNKTLENITKNCNIVVKNQFT